MTPELLRLILASVCLHAAMTGTRLAAPLLAPRQGHSAVAVGMLLALFALTRVGGEKLQPKPNGPVPAPES